MGTSYEDFSLWIASSSDGAGYAVRARCRAGEGEGQFTPPDHETGLTTLLDEAAKVRDLGSAARRSLPRRARQIGEDLFRALFTGEIGRLFDRCRGTSMSPGQGLRIKLHFTADLALELLDQPWELLCCPDTQDHFGLDRMRPVARFLEIPRAAEVVPFEPPLRVLLAAANPLGTSSLNLAQEIELIRKALLSVKAEVLVIERASLEGVRESLRRERFHVFHFMGHGTFDEQTGTGSFLFETTNGSGEPVTGESLARHLQDCPPGLAVLGACNSGRNGANAGRNPFGGVATALVRSGLPAVVAMRTPVADRAVIAFSKALYGEISLGEPVEAAVSEGRLAIYREDPFSPEWATPVLFLRTADGFLTAPAQEAAAAAIPPPILEEREDISFGQTSRIKAGSADIVNELGPSSNGSARIRNSGRIDVRGHLTIANRKSSRPPQE